MDGRRAACLVYLDCNGQACRVSRIVRVKAHIGRDAIHGSGHADVLRHKVSGRVRDGYDIVACLRQREGTGEDIGFSAIRQMDHYAAVAVGIDGIRVGHALIAAGRLPYRQCRRFQINGVALGCPGAAVAYVVRRGHSERICPRCVRTGGGIGAVLVLGQCCGGCAPLCRDGFHAGAAVCDGKRQRYLLGIAGVGKVVDGDGRRSCVDLADQRLTRYGLAVIGQGKGIDAVGFGDVGAAGDGGCAAVGLFHRHCGAGRRTIYGNAPRLRPGGVVHADRQLGGDRRACSGGRDRHALVSRRRHAVGVGGAGMEVIRAGAAGGLDRDA